MNQITKYQYFPNILAVDKRKTMSCEFRGFPDTHSD